MPTLARAFAAGLVLAVDGLKVQDAGIPALAQANGEMSAAEEAVWPGLFGSPHRGRRATSEQAFVHVAAPEQTGRVAVLVSGSMQRLLLTPLLANVVRANAMKGLEVDIFFGLTEALPGATKREEISDPKIASLLSTNLGYSFNKVMQSICQMARSHKAARCQWDLQSSDRVSLPKDAAHKLIMTQSSPLDTADGKAAVLKWRSLSRLWNITRANEGEDAYSAVVVSRDDDYWLSPHLLNLEEFDLDTLKVSAIPCLDATGVNDKATVMGRDAADVLLSTYEAWQRGDANLNGTRSAAEVWFRRATEAGLNLMPEPLHAAMAQYTDTGLPCFHEKTFSPTQRGSAEYAQCFGESDEDSPVATLFQTFSCETTNPNFYELLWPQQVQRLHQVISNLANRQERSPFILTVIDEDEVEPALAMLTSLQAVGEEASSLVIGTRSGVCKAMANGFGVPGSRCIVLQPAQDVHSRIFKHAILTTVAMAGLTDRLVYASPHVTFTKPLSTQLAATSKRIHFVSSSGSKDAKAPCAEAAGAVGQIDTAVMFLSDSPETSKMLLRAWAMMDVDNVTQQAALASVLEATGAGDFGLLSCELHSVQEAAKPRKERLDRLLSAEVPAGANKAKATGTEWIDRLRRSEASIQRVAASGKVDRSAGEALKKQAAWHAQVDAWKDAWHQRIQELQEENHYNETEIREIRRKEREYRRAHRSEHQKKHVRYLPPEEAAKVKARDEKWEADKEKQKFEDLEKAEQRREQFRREVEKAQAIIEDKATAKSAEAGKADKAPEPAAASAEEDVGAA